MGNLIYRRTARNFNPIMAAAGKETIAEVEHIVETGNLDPDQVHTPSIYVQRVIECRDYEKKVERRTIRVEEGE
jgi:3-oxoacid CoA-transferase subunit A